MSHSNNNNVYNGKMTKKTNRQQKENSWKIIIEKKKIKKNLRISDTNSDENCYRCSWARDYYTAVSAIVCYYGGFTRLPIYGQCDLAVTARKQNRYALFPVCGVNFRHSDEIQFIIYYFRRFLKFFFFIDLPVVFVRQSYASVHDSIEFHTYLPLNVFSLLFRYFF